jgi:hypothetical protein
MDAQDRQSHTKALYAEPAEAATIAPLVGLKVARSGTPPLQRPSGSLGVPQPRLTSVETFSMSLADRPRIWCTPSCRPSDAPFPGVDHLVHRMNSHRIVEEASAPSTISRRLRFQRNSAALL